MRIGRENFMDLIAEVQRQAKSKRDFAVPTARLTMVDCSSLYIDGTDVPPLHITEHTHNQIGTRMNIPARHYDRMRNEYPDVLDFEINTMWARKSETRMIRTLDGNARAFLSDRYARRDNIDLVMAIMPDLIEAKEKLDLIIESCEITERRLYIKFTTPKIQGEVRKGDIVQAGGIISNSEIGQGYATAYPFVKRLACLNGMVVEEYGQRRAHIGKRISAEEEAMEIYSDETIKADDQAFWLKIRDTMRLVLQPERFQLVLNKLIASNDVKVEASPDTVVKELGNKYLLDAAEQDSILKKWVGGDIGFTKWGLANAVTETAGTLKSLSYDRATDLERLGGTIVDLNPTEWKSIAVAV